MPDTPILLWSPTFNCIISVRFVLNMLLSNMGKLLML